MKRRSFLTTLAAAFALPKLPAPAPQRLMLIADECADLAVFNPRNYVGEFKWVNIAAKRTDPHGKFIYPIANK